MPKKKQVENTFGVQFTSDPEIKVVSTDISTIDLDFGRADLNQLRDKLNEVILKGNK